MALKSIEAIVLFKQLIDIIIHVLYLISSG
jgi:hypothetical protein